MRTLIAYASKYGTTKTCAQLLQEKLGEGTLLDLRKAGPIDLSEYDRVLIGGSFYVGKVQPEVTRFCQEHRDRLLKTRLGFFACGAHQEMMEEQLKAGFDQALREHAQGCEHLGYEILMEKMGFLHKMVVRKIMKTHASESRIAMDRVERLAQAMK